MEAQEYLRRLVDRLPAKAGAPARPFWARQEDHDTPGGWPTATIHIFRGDTEIGRYERNYSAFGEMTFEPFELNGNWYALYSSDYTATRIMSLPDCRDIGGEEPSSGGFCPVEFFVPRYRKHSMTIPNQNRTLESWYFESRAEPLEDQDTADWRIRIGSWQCLDVGFVAGCVWGDDSSWKLEALDLSSAASGILRRDSRFGHLEIAAGLPLATAVQLYRNFPGSLQATVLREEKRDIESGRRVDPYTDELLE